MVVGRVLDLPNFFIWRLAPLLPQQFAAIKEKMRIGLSLFGFLALSLLGLWTGQEAYASVTPDVKEEVATEATLVPSPGWRGTGREGRRHWCTEGRL